MDKIENAGADIKRISWEVAQGARQARQDQRRVKGFYDQLHAQGVHGDTMEAALREQMEVGALLARIPSEFFDGDENQVLAGAQVERTAEVHALLDEARPVLERLETQAGEWGRAYSETNAQVVAMRAAIGKLDDTLGSVPVGVQAAPTRERLAGIKSVASSLIDTLGRLEVESMALVTEESARLTENVGAMDMDLKRAGDQLTALETVLNELSVGLKALALQVASLRTRTDYPVIWKNTGDILAGLNRELNAIGAASRPREPEEMRRDLTRAARLNTRHRELARHCQQIEEAHTEWVELLEGPQLSRVDAWLEATRTTLKGVSNYAPANWPSADGVVELPAEVEDLAREVGRLVPADRQTTIAETELDSRMEDTRQLVMRLDELMAHIEKVRQRYTDVRETERLAVENLQNARVAFNQIQYIIHSNAFLSEFASGEAESLDNEALAILDELQGEHRGVVDKLALEVNTFLAKIETQANRWLDRLSADLRTQVDSLSASLTALDAIAQLDEPVVAEARRLLSASGKFGLDDRRAKSRYGLEELAPEFNRRSDYWQSCSAAASAMAEVDEYVKASYEEADYYRRETQELYAQVSTWLRQTRDWPPSSVSLDDEEKELKRLDEQWKALKNRRIKALALVQQLGNSSAKYQALANKICQGAERADQEQAQVEELEIELSELAQAWESLRYEYREVPEVEAELRELLQDIEHELAQVQHQYKQKRLNYKQVLRAMNDLNRRVKYYQVALDENSALDASGREIRRR